MRKFVLFFLTVLATGSLLAQNRQISGTVTGADGSPVAGATVTVQGTSTGTITDGSGRYSISAAPDGTLNISFYGMTPQSVAIGSRSVIDVVLQPDTAVIDDVIVVAYGTSRRSTFTGAASNITAEDLKFTPVETADKMLAGKVTGVRVASATGNLGSGGEVNVRGIGSISGSTAPLYVVDGVPINSENTVSLQRGTYSVLTSLNPSDIQSMTVLKDAAAASLYGSRAANGVIIITTKKGSKGQARISFNASYGISTMATNSFELMSGEEFYDYYKVSIQNHFADVAAGKDRLEPSFPSSFLNNADGYLTSKNVSRSNGEDWRKFLTRMGTDQNYSINVSCGSDTSNYYVGFAYQNAKGIAINNDMQRYSFIANVSSDVQKWLTLEGKAQMSYADVMGERDNYYGNTNYNPDGGGFGTSAVASLIASSNPSQFAYNADGSVNEMASMSSNIFSPVYETSEKEMYLKNMNARALINGNAEVRFTDNLKFRSVNGVDFMDVLTNEWWGLNSVNGNPAGGLRTDDTERTVVINSANTLHYTDSFADRHNLELLGGYEVNSMKYEFKNAESSNFPTDKLNEVSVGQTKDAGGYYEQSFMNSWFANANYNFDNKYYLGATIRTDKSSRLGIDNQRGTFWSVSGSWRISGENFLVDNQTLTNLRLRASYGTNGNLPSIYYGHIGAYAFTGIYGDNSAIYPSRPVNANLSWEKSKNLNIGLEWSLFRRFDFSVEYFNKRTHDLLLDVPSSAGTGFATTLQNSGSIRNSGIEFEFHGNNIFNSSSDQVRWDTDLMLSTLSAKVVSLPYGNPINKGDVVSMFRFEEGRDLYGMYLPKWHGVNPEDGRGQFYIDPNKAPTADNLTSNYNQASRGFVGKGYADVFGSWSNTLSWKGLSLDMQLTYQFGGNIYNYFNYFTQGGGFRANGGFNQAKILVGNYWEKEGDIVPQPRPTISTSNRNDMASSRWLFSSDHIRLKQLSLSYSLPAATVNKLHMSNLTFTVSAYNLAFIYAATKDMELESPLNGFLPPDMPLPRTITFGINIGF